MSEVTIYDVFWMDVMHSNIHVKTSLNIVFWNFSFFDLSGCLTNAINE